MQDSQLAATMRKETGKSIKKLRRQGKIPGIFYIHGQKNILLQVEEQAFRKLISSEHAIIDLLVGKKTHKCLIREIQFDPITGNVLHVDFMGVSAKEKITATVPVHLTGTPIGVKAEGAVLHQDMREIEVECLPADLPQSIELEVSHLHTDDSLFVRDLSIPNVTIVSDSERIVASVRTLKAAKLEEEVPATEEAAETEATEQQEDDE
ncbi:50S ribosomal protein L25 [candidate division KSB1 bacterium]|nr:50S ribosomal protein L25 [candidate division KSB1 bacterium]